MKCSSICFFLILFVCFCSKGQSNFTALSSVKQETVADTTKKVQIVFMPFINQYHLNGISNSALKTVPSTYYFNSLGFFCRKELQIERTLKFPVKFRLGSVSYTDHLEGKGIGTRQPFIY